jgi:hypothetical protein
VLDGHDPFDAATMLDPDEEILPAATPLPEPARV